MIDKSIYLKVGGHIPPTPPPHVAAPLGICDKSLCICSIPVYRLYTAGMYTICTILYCTILYYTYYMYVYTIVYIRIYTSYYEG